MSGTPLPRISVIVPTFNRKHYLPQLISSLASQTISPEQYEVIVVDNCSTDGSQELMQELVRTAACRIVYHRNPENLGVAKSRNIGARTAKAPLLAFTDSDCTASQDWLEKALEAADRNPQAALITGTVLNKPGVRSRFFSIGESAIRSENPFFPTCNIVYRRDVFFQVGGFDEKLYFYDDLFSAPLECGDVDLGWRIKETGHATVFAPAMLMYHELRIVSPLEWLVSYVRVTSVPLMSRMHPGFRKAFVWWGPFCLKDNLLFYLALIGIVLAATVHPALAVLSLLFVFRLVSIARPEFSLVGVLLLLPKLFFLTVRQSVICMALIYGSLRDRCLVL
jgi:GT2 family glycosyltransferase